MYMSEMVQERVASDNVMRRDLFSALLEASNESGKEALTDDELVGACCYNVLCKNKTS